MGVVGTPNFSLTAVMNAASDFEPQPLWTQSIRFACGPSLDPMTPMVLPQLGHGRGSWTFTPMSGADLGSKKSSCIDLAPILPHSRGTVRPVASMLARTSMPRQ
jgi:hypothetical protein